MGPPRCEIRGRSVCDGAVVVAVYPLEPRKFAVDLGEGFAAEVAALVTTRDEIFDRDFERMTIHVSLPYRSAGVT